MLCNEYKTEEHEVSGYSGSCITNSGIIVILAASDRSIMPVDDEHVDQTYSRVTFDHNLILSDPNRLTSEPRKK